MSFEMEKRMLWRGERVALDAGPGTVTGILSGITPDGYLRLETDGGEKIYSSGDVSLLAGG
jgi:BirA family biotin operon repressor/biotin-[acetyl-CoA-carboxylase] ligase